MSSIRIRWFVRYIISRHIASDYNRVTYLQLSNLYTTLLIGNELLPNLVRNCLNALITGSGFSRWTAWPQLGISTISWISFHRLSPLLKPWQTSQNISLAIVLNFVSFSPTMSKRGVLQCFKSSHNGLQCKQKQKDTA